MSKTLEELIGAPRRRARSEDAFLVRFGMGRNPFPTARTIISDVIYNQSLAIEAFASKVRGILSDEPGKRSLCVLGGTGAGKTHFLRHCQWLLGRYGNSSDPPFLIVEFLAGSNSISHLLRELLRRADDEAKLRGEYDFLAAVVDSMDDEGDFGPVRQSDLRSVLRLLHRAAQPSFRPSDRAGAMNYDALREMAGRWLSGGSLTATERKHLGVFSRLSTAPLMIRVFSEVMSLAHRNQIVGAVVVCLDEIESLFTGRSSTARVQGFLQDLRYMFDEATRESMGYSLLVISAATLTGATALRDFNYPLYQRLGFEPSARVSLEPIAGLDEVRDFARTYVDYEVRRVGSGRRPPNRGRAADFLSEDDLERALSVASAANKSLPTRQSGAVSQGQLLEALHGIVEEKRREEV